MGYGESISQPSRGVIPARKPSGIDTQPIQGKCSQIGVTESIRIGKRLLERYLCARKIPGQLLGSPTRHHGNSESIVVLQ